MTKRVKSFRVTGLGILALLISSSTMAQAPQKWFVAGRVLVSSKAKAHSIVYRYTVINTGTADISQFIVGVSYDPTRADTTLPTLEEEPIGTKDAPSVADSGENFVLDPRAVHQPAGWTPMWHGADMDTAQGKFYLIWTSADSNAAIHGGATLSGFTVEIAYVDHEKRASISVNVEQRPYTADRCQLGDLNYLKSSIALEWPLESMPESFAVVTPINLDKTVQGLDPKCRK